MTATPRIRLRSCNAQEVDSSGRYILYWMIAARRTGWNYGLQHAVELANQNDLPLLVLEALRCDYQWSSARMHRVFIQGMQDNAEAMHQKELRYYAYLEPKKAAGKGLLEALAEDAAAVVTDDYRCIFVPRMLEAAAEKLSKPLIAVDSNGIVPQNLPEKTFLRAYDFRRFFQKHARDCLAERPAADPLSQLNNRTRVALPASITDRWEEADLSTYSDEKLGRFPYQEDVSPVDFQGGPRAAEKALRHFIRHGLERYDEDRRNLDRPSTSGLSPYLRFGHLSSHQAVAEVLENQSWSPDQLGEKATGSSSGFWGTSEDAESFLDELVTWREVGYNMCATTRDYDQYDSLPEWARESLEHHASDERPTVYSLEEFEHSQTHDDLWNAAQTQLRRDGVIQNYMRMVWGKKILHWSRDPREALRIMIHLNNKYAIDGRDPNSYSGIFWVLGRYDRPWGPEREVFGKIRYMSEENTRKKLDVSGYLKRYASDQQS